MRSHSLGFLTRIRQTSAGSCRRWAALCGLLIVAAAVCIGTNSEAKVKIGKAPKESVAQLPIETFDGQRYTLAGLRGKVVVLDFFADWCAHSRDHIPALNGFTQADFDRGLQIIGQAVEDDRTSMTTVRKFIADQKINYPVGLTTDRKFVSYVESKDVSVPQTLVYGRDGKLVAHFSGQSAQLDAQLTETIKRELDKK